MSKLDKEIVLKTLRGYAEVNRITEAERRELLRKQNSQDVLEDFSDLYDAWEHSGKHGEGNWKRIEQWRLDNHIQLRRAFEKLALERGLIE